MSSTANSDDGEAPFNPIFLIDDGDFIRDNKY